jgi:hypothetical protein
MTDGGGHALLVLSVWKVADTDQGILAVLEVLEQMLCTCHT